MKLENTLENKARFFAQYWGQKIICFPHNKNAIRYDNPNKLLAGTYERNAYLELKPLSHISDEEVVEVAKLTHGSKFLEQVFTTLPKDKVTKYIRHITDGLKNYSKFDYLRSKGYALPWMDLSVEDLVEYGWVKLK